MKTLVLMLAAAIILTGCTSGAGPRTDSGVPATKTAVTEVAPAEAQASVSKAYSQFIDVRTAEEYSAGHALRAVNIPLDTFSANLDRLERNEPVYLICETGSRSKKAAGILQQAGFKNVMSITGGTQAWKAAGLPIETKAPHSVPGEKK